MADRLIRITTALAVVAVAVVAAIISYRHAYELVHSHGEAGTTARLVPFTVDGLIWAASMVILDARRRKQPAPALAKWSLAVGIVATVGANVAHGAAHGVLGALVSAWPALALVGSFELLMTLTRTAAPRRTSTGRRTHHRGTTRATQHRTGANPGTSGTRRVPRKPGRPRPPRLAALPGREAQHRPPQGQTDHHHEHQYVARDKLAPAESPYSAGVFLHATQTLLPG